MLIGHTICELIEREFISSPAEYRAVLAAD